MSDSKYNMTEEEIKEQGIVEEAEDAITDENYAEVSEKNISLKMTVRKSQVS